MANEINAPPKSVALRKGKIDRRGEYRPVYPGFAKPLEQRESDAFRAAGFRHQFAEHAAQTQNHRDGRQHAADALGKPFHDGRKLHPAAQPDEQRRQHNRQNRIHLETCDENNRPCHRNQREQRQTRLVAQARDGRHAPFNVQGSKFNGSRFDSWIVDASTGGVPGLGWTCLDSAGLA